MDITICSEIESYGITYFFSDSYRCVYAGVLDFTLLSWMSEGRISKRMMNFRSFRFSLREFASPSSSLSATSRHAASWFRSASSTSIPVLMRFNEEGPLSYFQLLFTICGATPDLSITCALMPPCPENLMCFGIRGASLSRKYLASAHNRRKKKGEMERLIAPFLSLHADLSISTMCDIFQFHRDKFSICFINR